MEQGSQGGRFQYKGGEIRLDKEGRWFHDGVEITHKLTRDLFSRNIKRDPSSGGYILEIGSEWSPVTVEDTPFMVRRVDVNGERAIAFLNDNTREDLDLGSLRVGGGNVLYCDVKDGLYPARFLRPAYYQLMQRLTETETGYAVKVGGRLWHIKT